MKSTITIKRVLLVSALTTLLSTPSRPVLADDIFVQSLCGYVAADDPQRLRKKLKENNLRLRKIYDSILCDGSSLLKFAIEKGANESGEFIVKKIAPESLTSGPDGVDILPWAEANGYASSPIVAAVKERAGS